MRQKKKKLKNLESAEVIDLYKRTIDKKGN